MVSPYFGQGYPGGLNLPSGLRVRADIGPFGELEDISDSLDREKISFERSNDSSASTASLTFLSEVGAEYDIFDVNHIYIDSDDAQALGEAWPSGWPSDDTWWRFFMGTTVKPDSTMLAPGERVLTLQCVDNSWWEKYPPMNAALPYPLGGTPFINTVSTSGISPGSMVTVIPFRMRNIYAGIDLFLTAPVSGSYVERVHVANVNYTGQLTITTQIPGAGVHTVPVTEISGILVGQPYHVYNVSDGTHWETIYPTAVSGVSGPGSFTANFVNSHKTGDWVLMAGSVTLADVSYSYPAYHTTVATAITEFASLQHIHPASLSFIQPGMKLTLSNQDRTYPEVVDVLTVDLGAGTFDAIVAWPKSGTWNIDAYPSIVGGPSDKTVLAGEWQQDVDNKLTPIAGILYTFYDDSQTATVAVPRPAAGTYDISPSDMSNIFPTRTVLVSNADGTARERVTVISTLGATFRIAISKPKTAGWLVFNGPYVDKTRIEEVQPIVALTSNATYTNQGVNYQGKSISQMWQEIEANPTNIETICPDPLASGTSVSIAPYNMFGIAVNKRLWIQNGDGTNGEECLVKTKDRISFTVDLTTSKAAGFHIFGRVAPRHYWSHNRDTGGGNGPWIPQPRYYDSEVRGKLALRVLSDRTVVDPVSGIQFGTFSVRRDGADHFNAVQVLGQNGAYARFVDWDDVNGKHGFRGSGRVLEGPIVVRQDVYTDAQAYEVGAAVVASHAFCKETPTITAYGLADPDLFSEVESITLYKDGEPDYISGKTLPVNRVRLSFEEGIARLEYELGSIVPEGVSHVIDSLSSQGSHSRLLGPPVHQTQIVNRSGNIERAATAYYVDASGATVDLPREVTLPEIGLVRTFYASIHKVDDSDNPVIVKAPDNSLIDGKGSVAIKRGGGPHFVYSDGTGYHTIQGFSNPHNVSIVHGDPIILADKDGNTKGTLLHDDSFGGDYAALDFTGMDPAIGLVQFVGPAGQAIAQDSHGTAIYDSLVVAGSNPARSNRTLGLGTQTTYFPSDCTLSDLSVTLGQLKGVSGTPDGAINGTVCLLAKTDDTTHTLTIHPHSGDLINGSASPIVLSARGYVLLIATYVYDFSSLYWEAHSFVDSIASVVSGPLSDRFNRSTSSTGIGTADSGQTWRSDVGVMGVGSGRANVTTLSGGRALSTVPVGFADVVAKATYHSVLSGQQVWLRVSADGTTGLVFECTGTSYKLSSYSGGSYTLIHSWGADTPHPTAAADDAILLVLDGPTVRFSLNGVMWTEVATSFNIDETRYGLGSTNSSATWDNFSVVPWTPEATKGIDWQFPADDAQTVGYKLATWSMPFDCLITRVSLYNMDRPSPANITTTVNLWRGVQGPTSVAWDGSPLNPAAFGPGGSDPGYSVTDFTGWTLALNRGDVLQWEIVTADPSVPWLMMVVEVTPV